VRHGLARADEASGAEVLKQLSDLTVPTLQTLQRRAGPPEAGKPPSGKYPLGEGGQQIPLAPPGLERDD